MECPFIKTTSRRKTQLKRKHIEELNITRAVAILAVLMIHSTSKPVTTLPENSSFYLMYLFFNIFPKFAVPAFILLSGFVLFYNYIQKDLTKRVILEFYKKRLINIIVPYFVFSVFYYVMILFAQTGDIKETFSLLFSYDFLKKLAIGKAYTHLYYLFIMIQFYLMFPFILFFMKKSEKIKHFIIPIGFIIQWTFILLNAKYWQVPYKGSVSLSYIFFFLVGSYFGIYYEKVIKYLNNKKTTVIWAIWLFFSFYNMYLYYYVFTKKMYITNSYIFEITWEIQSITASVVILQISYWIYHRWNKQSIDLLNKIGNLSFGIFLFHPFILLLCRKLVVTNSVNYHLWNMATFFIALAGSYVFVYLIAKNSKHHWVLFGTIPIEKKKKE